VALARVDRVPPALAVPAPAWSHWRLGAVRRVPVLASVHEAMAAAPLGRPGPGVVQHGDDASEVR
jgi:hypothetical protein